LASLQNARDFKVLAAPFKRSREVRYR